MELLPKQYRWKAIAFDPPVSYIKPRLRNPFRLRVSNSEPFLEKAEGQVWSILPNWAFLKSQELHFSETPHIFGAFQTQLLQLCQGAYGTPKLSH